MTYSLIALLRVFRATMEWIYSFKKYFYWHFIVLLGRKPCVLALLSCAQSLFFIYIYIFYKVSVSIEIVLLKQLVFWKLQLNKFLIQSVKVVF